MMRKWIIWFLVLAFLNFIIVPDSVLAGGSYNIGPLGSSGGEGAGIALAALLVVGLIVAVIVKLVKHSKSPEEFPGEQNKDTEISPAPHLDNQNITPSGDILPLPQEQNKDIEVSHDTYLDEQIFAPTGEVVIVQW